MNDAQPMLNADQEQLVRLVCAHGEADAGALQVELPQLPLVTLLARQYDLMRAAVWAPAPMPATRPGADDHKRYASRGHGC